jgi:ABC-2 type transport system permease protein
MKLLLVWRLELLKLFTQKGAYAGFAVLAALSALIAWGTWKAGPIVGGGSGVSEMFVMGGKLVSAQSICYMMLKVPMAVVFFLPLLIATVSGGLIASENKSGTLRTILVRPLSRVTLAAAKTLTAWTHAVVLVAFLLGFTYAAAYLIFGGGDIINVGDGKFAIIPRAAAWWRLLLGYGLAAVGMCAVASVSLLLSALFENALTAAGLTFAFVFVSVALIAIPYFEPIRPYLLTSHLQVCDQAFGKPIDWPLVRWDLLYTAPYALVPAVLTALVLWRKDVTC